MVLWHVRTAIPTNVSDYRLLLSELVKRLGWRFPVLIAWTALVGLSEGISVVLLLPLLNRVGIASGGTQSVATRLIEKTLTTVGATSVGEILLLVILIAAVQAILAIFLNWWTVRLARSEQCRCQLQLFRSFMRAKWTFLTDRKAGELTNAIVTESERLARAIILCLSLLGSAVVVVIYVGLAALTAWHATLGLVCFGLAIAGAMSRLYRKSYALGASVGPFNSQLQSLLEEQFIGAKFIKASAGVDAAAAQLEPLVRQLGNVNAFAAFMPLAVRGILECAALISLAVFLVVAGLGLGGAPGNVIIVLALFGRLFPRMTAVQAQLHSLNANVHSVRVIRALLVAAEADAEREYGSLRPLKISRPSSVTVRNLSVELAGRVVLDHVSMTAPIPGIAAIVGKSGAGKSTLIHTLLSLADPSAGSIQLGNYELASAPLGAWRRTIGYVPQDTILFHASIRDNLTLVNPAASEAEIRTAARRAHALEFIKLLPEGFETIVGDQGVKLSGGQRQRIGIARALLINPALLILDEAMSALDTRLEIDLLHTLEELREEIGILLVAHRLAAARVADVIYVLEAGKIVEAGSWNELMMRKAQLYALAQAQSAVEDRVASAL